MDFTSISESKWTLAEMGPLGMTELDVFRYILKTPVCLQLKSQTQLPGRKRASCTLVGLRVLDAERQI